MFISLSPNRHYLNKKAAEADHEEAIGLSFLSDWQRETNEFCRLIKERIETKKINFRMFRWKNSYLF